ncbi:DNA-binding transcriptional regulator, LysR family [Pseudobutyrivibrio sp. ACV-2]|uniref:LysR family transcriptional regulator n=1 Tax=Pseudobutyrivibrio sp. ACV-2 TaxID=1520801 RepID=UPI00089AE0BE|nr:LysR family transcriptional regulator [Pseudobutyrivibrio sp. ACV-2]SEA40471.1 DNA-binding transcriptional regulator, LysR family [Pseudobutyrivibrio sp. ACV-2]
MNQKQLFYFSKVYETHCISDAAKLLYVSHQVVSKTILSLEDELGLQLFVRKNKEMVPTKAAVNLYPHTLNILQEFSLVESKDFILAENRKPLNIMCSYDSIGLISTDFFDYFSDRYKDILVHIEEMPDRVILDKLNKHEIELAMLPGPLDYYKYETNHLISSSYRVLVSKNNPLAQLETIPFKALKDYQVIFKGSRSPLDIVQLDSFKKGSWNPNIMVELSDTHYAFKLVYENKAVAMVLDYMADEADSDLTVARPFKPNLTKSMYLVNNANVLLCPEALTFKNELLKWFSSH